MIRGINANPAPTATQHCITIHASISPSFQPLHSFVMSSGSSSSSASEPSPSSLYSSYSELAEDEGGGGSLLFGGHWDCPGCPPPTFDLPPPPRPPFLDEDSCAVDSSPYETCSLQPLVVIDSGSALHNDLINVLLVGVCALTLVTVLLVVACVIWR